MHEQFHGLSVFTYYVNYGCFKSALVPQGHNTSFARPLASPGWIEAAAVEPLRGTGLDNPPYGNSCPGGADHRMYVSSSDMNGPREPSAQQTGLEDSLEDTLPSRPAEGRGLDTHLTHHRGMQFSIWAWKAGAGSVVKPVHAATRVAVQVSPMTGECQKVSERE